MLKKVNTVNHVVLANSLVRSAQGLNIGEKRLLMLAISKLDSKAKATFENMTIRLTVADMVKEFGLNPDSTYQDTKRALEGIMKRQIRVGDHKTGELYQWVTRAAYQQKEGWFEIELYPRIAPFLFELKKEFTSYRLSRAGALRSMYSWRLFELLMQFKKTGLLKIDINDFNFALETPDSLRANFANLRNRVLDPAIKEIREKDGLAVTWEASKTGRKVTALTFKFPIEQQAELPLDAETASKPPKRRAKAQATQTTDPDPQDALSRYNGLKSMAELSGEPLQSLASEQEWGVFQGRGWVA